MVAIINNAEINEDELEEAIAQVEEALSNDKTSQEIEVKEDEKKTITIDELLNAEPLTVDELDLLIINTIMDLPAESEDLAWFYQRLDETFGEEYDLEKNGIALADPRTHELAQEYLDKRLKVIKDSTFSLNANTVNDAATEIFELAGLEVDMSNVPMSAQHKIMEHRLVNSPKLLQSFKVMTVSSDIFNMMNAASQTMATRIEVENKVQQIEDFHAQGIIDNEQAAMGYHNLAMLYEYTEARKNSVSQTKQESRSAHDSLRKALSLTSNPSLIKICFDCLPDSTNNKMILVQEACDRALARPNNTPASLYKTHILYSKALLSEGKPKLYGKQSDNYIDEALYHYDEAYNNAETKERKEKVLRHIIKLQRVTDNNDGYIDARIKLAENFLTGKTKVRELMSISEACDDKEMKKFLMESAVNELIDTNTIKKEEKSLLLKNVIGQLEGMYDPNNKVDASKLEITKKLMKKHCAREGRKETFLIRASSRGHDYFEQ